MPNTMTSPQPDQMRADRAAGLALMLAGIASVAVMAAHPTSAHAAGLAAFVHAAMIVLLSLAGYGFLHFAIRMGLRPSILAGLVAYAVSIFGHIGAATVNGFVVPALAQRGGVSQDVFLFAWELNQALAGLGVSAAGLAFMLWSVPLVRGRTADMKALGVAGLISGFVQTAGIVMGSVSLDVHGALLLYGLHALWAAPVGVQLYRGIFAAPPAVVID